MHAGTTGFDAESSYSQELAYSVAIERSPEAVWKYFIATETWFAWWGGDLRSAEWVIGGTLVWEMGGSSKVVDILAGKMVKFGDSWVDNIFLFEPGSEGATKVTYVQGIKGAAHSDVSSALAEVKSVLWRLKEEVEFGG